METVNSVAHAFTCIGTRPCARFRKLGECSAAAERTAAATGSEPVESLPPLPATLPSRSFRFCLPDFAESVVADLANESDPALTTSFSRRMPTRLRLLCERRKRTA